MKVGVCVPNVTFKLRVRNNELEGPNPYEWKELTSLDLWGKGRHVLFSLPGAFTPTCSTYQLPGFEAAHEAGQFDEFGVESVGCISVNDAFVMNAWAKQQGLENVEVIPDGSGTFTRQLGMLVKKDNLGFGDRSWRYAMIINDGVVEAWFEEPGREDDCSEDPYGETSPENILDWFNANMAKAADE